MAKVKLSREELRSLYFFHMDIAEDESFGCKTDHSEKIAEDRKKRANKFRKILKRDFDYEVEAKKTTED